MSSITSLLEWHFDLAPDEGFIRDLFELRKIVEPSAAALAALRRSDAQLSKLADALSRMARTIAHRRMARRDRRLSPGTLDRRAQ